MSVWETHEVPGAGYGEDRPIRQLPIQARSYEPPISLYAGATVPANGEVLLQSRALGNFTGRPIEIHEIRIGAVCTPAAGDPLGRSALGNVLALSLSIGNVAITDGYVPASLLGKVENLIDENRVEVAQVTRLGSSYVWQLARPFYLPPDAQLDAHVRHLGLINADIAAHVSIAGRVVAKRPVISAVPFVSPYLSRTFDFATAGSDVSGETDLFNSTGAPLHVTRFIGRIGGFGQVVTKNLAVSDQWGRLSQLMRLRMVASTGEPIVARSTLFRSVFSATSRTLECEGYVMPAGAFNRVTIAKDAGSAPGGPTFAFLKAQAMISMLGWREVKL